ncbi:unnamed protein product, partial [Caretta caretta]
MEEQVKATKQLGDHLTNLGVPQNGTGESRFDKYNLDGSSCMLVLKTSTHKL